MMRRAASVFLLIVMFLSPSVACLPMRFGSKGSSVEADYGENQATPKYGGTLRIGESRAKPSTLNPLLDTYYYYRSLPMFNSLLTYDEHCRLQPELAESYEISEDNLNVTFHLCENVSWHDGVQFNASDVKFTLDTIRDDPNVISDWCLNNVKNYVDSTEVTGTFTVVVHLKEPVAAILHHLSFIPIIPRHIYEGTDLTTNPANENPIGTGPFKFGSWAPKVSLTVTAYAQYFKGRPYLDSIFYRWDLNVSTQLTAALEGNSVDMIGGGLTSGGDVDLSQIQVLLDTTGNSVAVKEAAEYWGIYLNMSNPMLQIKNVRHAIAHAINRTKITSEAYYGYASVAKGMVPPSIEEWYNPDVTDYELNKTLAEELLDHECPRGPNGWRFSLVIKALPRTLMYPWEESALNIMRDDLVSVGINASIEIVPISHFTSRNFDAFFMGWIFGVIGPDDLYDVFHSTGMAWCQSYCNSTLDALLEEARGSFNETLRKIDFDLAQEIVAQDLPQIFICHPPIAVACNNDFHGQFLSTPPINGRLTPYFLAEIWYDRTLSGEGNCPFWVCFADLEGRRTGYYEGTAYEDIPDSAYSGIDSDPQLVKIREPAGLYTVELFGKENASYRFEFANIALDYKDVWLPQGFIHENETIAYVVKVYGDGSIKVYGQEEYSPHDLGVRSIAISRTVVGQDYAATLNATVFNWGDYTEQFNITFYANSTALGTVTNVVIPSEGLASSCFTWSTSGFARGHYTVAASVEPVPGESETTDNLLTWGNILVTIPGDVDGNKAVNIFDIVRMAGVYGLKSPDPRYDVYCDIEADGDIDIFDLVKAAGNYGKHW